VGAAGSGDMTPASAARGASGAATATATAEPFMEPFAGHDRLLTDEQQAILGRAKKDVDTPALLLDLDKFERNATRISTFLREHGVGWRPHSKAHKSPQVARRQMQLGALGIICAKPSEAEVMVDYGIPSVLIANEQGRREKFDRIAALNRRAEVITCADSPTHVELASAAGIAAGQDIPMLVSIDVGMDRTGALPGEATLNLARLISKTKGVQFKGVMGYEGHLLTVWPLEEKRRQSHEAMSRMIDTVRLIERDGIPVEIVSGGGSGTYMTSGEVEGMTEVQAGGGCFLDRFYGEECHMDEEFEYALTVVSTITSRPIPERAIMDAGFKTMSDGESGRPRPIDLPGSSLVYLSAEHGNIALEPDAHGLKIGDRVEWILGYSDTTTFLHNHFVGIRNDRVEAVIPLLGRGKLT
jgi:D-serine deaminase-like pyridoxal phosphate-dependent protein